MLPLIESRRTEIAELCRRFLVQRLDVFGSAARVTDFTLPRRTWTCSVLTIRPDERPPCRNTLT
jgi:hypothetical protein